MEYTLALALDDYIPVILSSAGLYFIAKMIARTDTRQVGHHNLLAQLSWILVTTGGTCKATWKLLMSISNGSTNVRTLDNALFVCMALGFSGMAFALYNAQRQQAGKLTLPFYWFVVTVGSFYVGAIYTAMSKPDSRAWVFILLGLTTIANVVFAVLLIRQATKQGMRLEALLFTLNIVVVFIMARLAGIRPQTIPLQWMEQTINTISQGAFAYSAWRLSTKASDDDDGELEKKVT